MQEWNIDFYQSKSWRDCRESYLIAQHFTCERCRDIAKIVHHKIHLTPSNIHDPYISLAHENLEALCQTCHNTEHHKAAPEAARYTFDRAGNVIPPPTARAATPAHKPSPPHNF